MPWMPISVPTASTEALTKQDAKRTLNSGRSEVCGSVVKEIYKDPNVTTRNGRTWFTASPMVNGVNVNTDTRKPS